MRRLLLLTALCMVGALVFAPAALGQDGDLDCPQLSEAEEQAVFAADLSDPNGLDANNNGVPCEDDMTDDGSYVAPGGMETTTMEPTEMEETSTAEAASEATTVYSTPVAEADDEESATASASAEAEELPETGGAVSPALLTVLPAPLLVGSGVMAVRVIRRS